VGYAVELALKACISNLIQPNVISEKAFVNAIYTHSLGNLLSIAGLLPEFNADAKADVQFAANWAIVSKRTEESRYEFWDSVSSSLELMRRFRKRFVGILQLCQISSCVLISRTRR
jgi:hypothetical protein